MIAVRPLLVRVVLTAGVGASLASTQPAAGLSAIGEERRALLNAATPSLVFDATATATADVPILGGEIGLNVSVDPDASGSLLVSLRSETTGAVQEADILDPQAQGVVRVGIDAFAGCPDDDACVEDLVIELARTDDALDGDLGLDFQLDGLVDTDGEPTTGELSLRFD
jgi:hypothetical protein